MSQGRLSSPSPMMKTSMNGASTSGFCAPGPPAMTSGWSSVRSLGVQRNAAQVEHGQDVGVADFVLQAEADDVEFAQRRERLQAVERQAVLAQLGLEIDPRREGPFAGPLRIVVHDRVQHLQAVMAHAERVGVGKRQAQPAAHLAMILDDAVEFAAEILGRRLHARQDSHDGVFQGRVAHEGSPSRGKDRQY